MRAVDILRYFSRDKRAVSEEFTSLPALTVVLVGFSVFIILLSQAYGAYTGRESSIEDIQDAKSILEELTNPQSECMLPGGVLNISALECTEGIVQDLQERYARSDISFIIQVTTPHTVNRFPNQDLPKKDRVAISKIISINTNAVETLPGELTVIAWTVTR